MRWIAEFLAVKRGHAGTESVGKKSTVALKWTERRGKGTESTRKQLYLRFTAFKTCLFSIFLPFQLNFTEITADAHIGKYR